MLEPSQSHYLPEDGYFIYRILGLKYGPKLLAKVAGFCLFIEVVV